MSDVGNESDSEVFVDYKGAKISDVGPYIYNTYQPFDAVLVWIS